jgi:hypothetical protein
MKYSQMDTRTSWPCPECEPSNPGFIYLKKGSDLDREPFVSRSDPGEEALAIMVGEESSFREGSPTGIAMRCNRCEGDGQLAPESEDDYWVYNKTQSISLSECLPIENDEITKDDLSDEAWVYVFKLGRGKAELLFEIQVLDAYLELAGGEKSKKRFLSQQVLDMALGYAEKKEDEDALDWIRKEDPEKYLDEQGKELESLKKNVEECCRVRNLWLHRPAYVQTQFDWCPRVTSNERKAGNDELVEQEARFLRISSYIHMHSLDSEAGRNHLKKIHIDQPCFMAECFFLFPELQNAQKIDGNRHRNSWRRPTRCGWCWIR